MHIAAVDGQLISDFLFSFLANSIYDNCSLKHDLAANWPTLLKEAQAYLQLLLRHPSSYQLACLCQKSKA